MPWKGLSCGWLCCFADFFIPSHVIHQFLSHLLYLSLVFMNPCTFFLYLSRFLSLSFISSPLPSCSLINHSSLLRLSTPIHPPTTTPLPALHPHLITKKNSIHVLLTTNSLLASLTTFTFPSPFSKDTLRLGH